MEAGRILIGIGTALLVVGVILWALGRTGLRGLPGGICYELDGVRVYIPIVTAWCSRWS